jgi:hypothetical protein
VRKRDKEQNKKVKFTLERAMKAQREVEIQLYSFFNFSGRRKWVVIATPRPLYS